MRNVVRVLLALAVVAVGSVQVSSAQSFRDAGSKITGNYNGVYAAPRTYRSYSYAAPTTAAVVNAPAVVNSAPQAAVAPTPQPAVVAAPQMRTQQAQSQVRTQRTYSYQPSYQNYGYRSFRSNSYDPALRRADAKVLGH
jgi:hypothetical protein